MSHSVEPTTIPADLDQLARALREAFPALDDVAPLRRIGEGFNSVALETAGGMVFLIAKNGDMAARQTMEARLLPVLAGRVPISIPRPAYHTPSARSLPFGAIGYRKLPGRTLGRAFDSPEQAQRVAEALAGFLVAFHTFPAEEAIALGVGGPDAWRAEVESMRAESLPALRDVLTSEELRLVTRWWESFLNDERAWSFTPRLTHSDLWYENILVDGAGDVTGVLDFESVMVGDSCADFATSFHMRAGHDVGKRLSAAYGRLGGPLDDDHVYHTARLWELRPFGGIQYSARTNNAQEMEASVAKLRRGPIFGGVP